MGLPMMFGLGALNLFENLLNAGQIERGNQLQTERVNQANDLLDAYAGRLDGSGVAAYRDPKYLTSAAGTPKFSLGGMNAGGSAGTGFDVEEYFRPSGSAKNSFLDAYGGGYDYSRLAFTDVAGTLGGGTDRAKGYLDREFVDPMSRAETVGSFYNPEQFNAFAANEMQKIGASSQARSTTARQNLVSQALASGRGLDEIQGQLDAMQMAEAQSRAGQATGVNAAAEGMRAERSLAQANAQTGALQTQAALNANLAKAGSDLEASMSTEKARLLRDIGLEEGNKRFDAAKAAGDYSQYDISTEQDAKGSAYSAFDDAIGRDMLSAQSGAAVGQWLESLMAQLTGQQSSNLTGQDFSVPQFDFGSNMANNWAQIQAAKKSKPPKPSPFSFNIGI